MSDLMLCFIQQMIQRHTKTEKEGSTAPILNGFFSHIFRVPFETFISNGHPEAFTSDFHCPPLNLLIHINDSMPVPDSQKGNICVWFTSCFFFVAIVTGGIFLVIYISDPVAHAWFPVAGVVLVGLPWLFWILTCLYRCVMIGLRDGGGAIEGGGRPRRGQNGNAASRNSTDSATELQVLSPRGNGRRVRFGAVEVVDEPNDGGRPGKGTGDNDEEHPLSIANDGYYDISLDSANEIEAPLASSSPS